MTLFNVTKNNHRWENLLSPLITLLLLSSCTYLPQVDKVRSFKDMRKFRRRALCIDDTSPGSVIIIESTRRMTMNEFAAEVARYSKNAVNLDMGRWAYGWIGKKTHTLWAICLTHSIYVVWLNVAWIKMDILLPKAAIAYNYIIYCQSRLRLSLLAVIFRYSGASIPSWMAPKTVYLTLSNIRFSLWWSWPWRTRDTSCLPRKSIRA